jgi:(hydroxyamino)benzene mutase
MPSTPAAPVAVRHPLDPDPVRSGKAAAVLVLGIFAAVTGFFVGGLVPATLALLLARDARREMVEARGYLTGGRRLRTGVALAWVGIVLAAAAIVLASIVGLLHMAADQGGAHLDPNVN